MTTVINLVNHATVPFTGWLRTNVDRMPSYEAGRTDRCSYVLGRATGLDTRHLDLRVSLAAGERLKLDLSDARQSGYGMPAPSLDFVQQLWRLTIAGQRMHVLTFELNGAAYDVHARAKVGPMLNVDLWLRWYPDQPAWCRGSIAICASNPLVQDVVGWIPPDFTLRFGDAIVSTPGKQPGSPLMNFGDWLADGQPRVLPLMFTWLRYAPADIWPMLMAMGNLQVQVVGLKTLHAFGNPLMPQGFDAVGWTNSLLPEVLRVSHTWEKSPMDPAPISDSTGAQGGQSFCCGPAMVDPTALAVVEIAGLDVSWPCCHLEANGDPLDYSALAHRELKLWDGRVNRRISTDTLGKDNEPDASERHGYSGPDSEHWFDFPAWAAKRLTGDPASEWILANHARLFLKTWNLDPPWTFPNRAEGWMGFLVAELVRNLTDRKLAAAVANRFRDLCDQLIIPQMLPNDAWWSWTEATSIGGKPGYPRAMPWQAEVMAGGMDMAGAVCGHDPARKMAFHMAQRIIERAYVKRNGRWTVLDVIDQVPTPEVLPAGSYDFFGMRCFDVVLRHEPANPTARELRAQWEREATTYQTASWMLKETT
jgi:hypothetical protein